MINKILSLTQSFISIPSTKDNPSMLKKVIHEAIKDLKDFTVEYFEKNQTPSVLIYSQSTRPNKFKIILNAHLDVVAAKDNQYQPYQKNGRLFGRGAIDMKAATAVEILVFKEIAKKLNYPLGLQLVTDEEIGGFNGTKYQIEKGVRADFVIAGEPTDFGINNQAKGIIWAKVKAKGKSAHGAYPWQGDNALLKLQQILTHLFNRYPLPKKEAWQTTINLSKIETPNNTFNQVPDLAIANLDIRFIPKEKKAIIKNLNQIAKNLDGQLEIVLNEPCQFTDRENSFIKKLYQITKKVLKKQPKIIVKHGGSDIRHFNRVGCDGITFGPKGEGLHSDNEWVDVKSLKDYYLILKEFLLNL